MPTTTRMRVDGLRELGERMRALSSDIALKVARGATNAGAQIVKKKAIGNIEHNSSKNQTSVDTGSLRDGVVVKRLPKRDTTLTSEHIVTVRRRQTTKQKLKGKQKAAPHANLVEFGTVHMPPEPYLRPAFDEGKIDAADAIKRRLEERIKKAEAGK